MSFEYVKTITKMLETIDAEMFLSGHSEPTDRESIRNHVERMKKLQEKVKDLVNKGASLEDTKSEFAEEEGRLVEVIYEEVRTLG